MFWKLLKMPLFWKVDLNFFQDFFQAAGVNQDQINNTSTRQFIYDFIKKNGGLEQARWAEFNLEFDVLTVFTEKKVNFLICSKVFSKFYIFLSKLYVQGAAT